MTVRLDHIDRKLLKLLQADCSRSVQALGEAVGLSPSACHRRVHQLEVRGVIAGYRASLNPRALGLTMQFFVEIALTNQSEALLDAFEAAVRQVPEILECCLMAGQADYILRVACRDQDDFERVHRLMSANLPGVARMHSNMCIRSAKPGVGLPV